VHSVATGGFAEAAKPDIGILTAPSTTIVRDIATPAPTIAEEPSPTITPVATKIVKPGDNGWQTVAAREPPPQNASAAAGSHSLFINTRNILAVIGVIALMLQVLRAVR
jgi:hypothetical protein